jgi:hypothetical protein
MEIYNGPVASVHYVSFGNVPAAEQARMTEQERRESHSSLLGDLHALLREYVQHERSMERRRTAVQQLYYGYTSSTWSAWSVGGGWWYPWYWGSPGYSQGNSSVQGLGEGPADEGVIKTELARVLAQMAAPVPAAQMIPPPKAARDAGAASDSVAAADVPPVSPGTRIVVSTRHGDRTENVEGTFLRASDRWIVLRTKSGNRIIPREQISEMLEPSADRQMAGGR